MREALPEPQTKRYRIVINTPTAQPMHGYQVHPGTGV